MRLRPNAAGERRHRVHEDARRFDAKLAGRFVTSTKISADRSAAPAGILPTAVAL
jgi:hypothetical protein